MEILLKEDMRNKSAEVSLEVQFPPVHEASRTVML